MVPFCRLLGAACGLRAHAAVVFSNHHSLQPPLRRVYRMVYVVADTLHVACCIVSKGCSEMLLFCVLRWDGACLRHAAFRASCSLRRACRCRLLLLHLLCCMVSAARCIACVGCCRRQGATVHPALVCRVLVGCCACLTATRRSSLSRSPIPQPEVYVWHGEADRVGGGVGWRCAGWWRRWRGEDGWWVCPLQGRQHRTL